MIYMDAEDVILRLVLSAIAGAIIGAEREYRNKSAGFRTLILISIGSCLFTIASMLIEEESKDRIASNIVTGIGFVGAGVIFKSETGVKGLTTAATVWVTAAIGMSIAGGFYVASAVAAGLVMIVLYLFSFVGRRLETMNLQLVYKISFVKGHAADKQYEEFMESNKMSFTCARRARSGENLQFLYNVKGSQDRHNKLLAKLTNDPNVTEFESIDSN
jgi:putative Mg2+ transporter-C (MgtC) family protein